ncbi:TetR/AcrR family transcriptional regulator [Paenisporosarcina quisquiliarum]|uniref:TetR/AcrR family transcriptional regulator n=1 Tax=Paenisporosarcina quisquiliarum TaxID=365346 RepID=UPI0037350B7C
MTIQIDDKQLRIFHAAKQQFVNHGFHQTSTQQIAEAAGVSKGLLFHHYQSKKKLYLLLIENSIHLLATEVENEWTSSDEDFFVQLKRFIQTKIKAAIKYPMEYQLLIQAFSNAPKSLSDEIHQLILQKSQEMKPLSDQAIYGLLKTYRLREGIDNSLVEDVIRTVLDRFAQRLISQYAGKYNELILNKESVLLELDAIIDVLKHGVSRA